MINKRKGFTLIELIITLAIISILLGAVFFTVTRRDNSRREILAAADQIKADIRYTRQRAIMEDRVVQIYFDGRNNVYTIRYASPRETIRIVTMPEGMRIRTHSRYFGFRPRGTPSGGGRSVTIESEHHVVVISVVGAGGRVRSEITWGG